MLAASPVLFTAHYREWCPLIIRQIRLAVSCSKFRAAIMSFCTSVPSWVIPYNPVFKLQVDCQPVNPVVISETKSGSFFQYCITRRSTPLALLVGRHYVPPVNLKLCSFNLLVILRGIPALKRCWLQVLCCLRLTTESSARS